MVVTQWFDVSEPPVHPGLYEVAVYIDGVYFACHMQIWNGSMWAPSDHLYPVEGDKWRGLAEKPARVVITEMEA